MDWSMVAAMAATVSASVALWISPPMQKFLHRHDVFKQLQPFERDILKAIQCSRLDLGSIVIRRGSVESIMELTVSTHGNISERRMLIVGQSFYQLSLESLESRGLLTRVTVVRYPPTPLPKDQKPPEYYAYRITGLGTQFIHKYAKKLCGKRHMGCYIDLKSSDPEETRYQAWILKGSPTTYEIPTSELSSWVIEKQEDSSLSCAIIPSHNLGLKENDMVHIVRDPDPYVGHDEHRAYVTGIARRAKVLSASELDAVDDEKMRIEEHTRARLHFID